MKNIVIGAVALLVVAGSARGQVGFVSQSREVTASATAGTTVTETLTATGFSLFDQMVTAENSVPFVSSGFGSARQRSSFENVALPGGPAVAVDVTGRVQGTGSGGPPSGGGSGFSRTELTFTIGRDTPWELISAYSTGDSLGGYINTVTLERLSPVASVLANHSDFGVVNRLDSGTLTPGTYKFTANFRAFGGPQGTVTNFNIDLVLRDIPAPMTGVIGLAGAVWGVGRRRARTE